jgi:hypothetical protein
MSDRDEKAFCPKCRANLAGQDGVEGCKVTTKPVSGNMGFAVIVLTCGNCHIAIGTVPVPVGWSSQ